MAPTVVRGAAAAGVAAAASFTPAAVAAAEGAAAAATEPAGAGPPAGPEWAFRLATQAAVLLNYCSCLRALAWQLPPCCSARNSPP